MTAFSCGFQAFLRNYCKSFAGKVFIFMHIATAIILETSTLLSGL
jgi:hypothetical protein